jgi:glycosyltransferase involved in cell wall biosynthesis
MAILVRRVPARLIVVGEGELRDELERLARELGISAVVRFLGQTSNPYSLMNLADVLVVSSAWEGFSLVIVEALALGLPVVATDCPSGPAEILEQGRYGRLVPVGDPTELAAAVAETLENRHQDAAAGIPRAAFFSEERCLRAYLELLGESRP